MTLRFGSVCSGIEAASVAWESLGFTPAWFSEIAPWPSKFLSTRYPRVPNHGSLIGLANRITGSDRQIDILIGGTPCQAFSVSGLRGGLADERGNLTLEFARLAQALRPRWLVWENVPGVLSDGTNAFGCLLGALSELGYGLAWRVLDAQFFGLAQRRQRVFLVGHLGAAAAAGAVLFEPEGVRRNPPTRRAEGEEIAGTLGSGSGGFGGDLDRHGAFIPVAQEGGPDVAQCLTTSVRRLDSETETFVTASFDETQVTSPGNRSSCDPSTAALTASGRPPSIAFNARQGPVFSKHVTGALDTDGTTQAVCVLTSCVRRLTPRECERLQGFPDDHTALPGAKDTPRYHALGNSMAVPVIRWLGERIARVDALLRELEDETCDAWCP